MRKATGAAMMGTGAAMIGAAIVSTAGMLGMLWLPGMLLVAGGRAVMQHG